MNAEPETRNSELLPLLPLGPEAIAAKFGLKTTLEARAFMRRLPHVEQGRHLYTTEALLVRWFAQAVKHPPAPQRYGLLEEAAQGRALDLIEALVTRQKLELWPAGRVAALEARVAALESESGKAGKREGEKAA